MIKKAHFKGNRCFNSSLLTRKLPFRKLLPWRHLLALTYTACKSTLWLSRALSMALASKMFQFPFGFHSECAAHVCLEQPDVRQRGQLSKYISTFQQAVLCSSLIISFFSIFCVVLKQSNVTDICFMTMKVGEGLVCQWNTNSHMHSFHLHW